MIVTTRSNHVFDKANVAAPGYVPHLVRMSTNNAFFSLVSLIEFPVFDLTIIAAAHEAFRRETVTTVAFVLRADVEEGRFC